ncbi:LacI family DNA-binding transcriptional regulator [Rouxiella sp. T17]|uniref:LacI family DNA-binding transcriptional regulator n=1 Tax=Rouxiella sp. T17 TaxID=3085684 RepID=UPI002FC9F2A4
MIKKHQNEKGRVTLIDVAKEAGVGQATVDRFLNGRTTVKAKTAEKIRAAVDKLGYRAAQIDKLSSSMSTATKPPAAELTPMPRLGFIFPPVNNSIYQLLIDPLAELLAGQFSTVFAPRIIECDIQDFAEVSAAIETLSSEVEFLGIVALDDPTIGLAIQAAAQRGVKIFTLFSPLSNNGQRAHIGLDDRKAGRSAAWVAQRLMPATSKLAIFQGNSRFLCQESCEISFRSYFRERNVAVDYIGPLNTKEDAQHAEHQTHTMLAENSDIGLIYAPCGGVKGIIQAVTDSKRKEQIAIICHGPFPGWEQALIDESVDVIIYQDMKELSEAVVALLSDHPLEDRRLRELDIVRNEVRFLPISFQIKFRENI